MPKKSGNIKQTFKKDISPQADSRRREPPEQSPVESAEQARINEKKALESGEESAV
jgi:hypothetical protein